MISQESILQEINTGSIKVIQRLSSRYDFIYHTVMFELTDKNGDAKFISQFKEFVLTWCSQNLDDDSDFWCNLSLPYTFQIVFEYESDVIKIMDNIVDINMMFKIGYNVSN